MKGKIRDCCIGYAVKGWLTLIWLLIVLSGAKVFGQDAPKTDHIKRAGCSITHNREFTKFGLHVSVEYTDGTPDYALAVEANAPDPNPLYDQCEAFSKAMQMARIEQEIADSKAELKRQKEDHFFLNAKLAKR